MRWRCRYARRTTMHSEEMLNVDFSCVVQCLCFEQVFGFAACTSALRRALRVAIFICAATRRRRICCAMRASEQSTFECTARNARSANARGSLPTTAKAMATLKWCAVQSTPASNGCVSMACDLFFNASRSVAFAFAEGLRHCGDFGFFAVLQQHRFGRIRADGDTTRSVIRGTPRR